MGILTRAMRRAAARVTTSERSFSIISNNYWGVHVYERLGIPYRTPFVGTHLSVDHYLSLLERFDAVIHEPLKFIRQPSCPCLAVATIGDGIEIHFTRCSGNVSAHFNWNDRLSRLSANRFVKLCDNGGLTQQQVDRFEALPFKNKVCFVGSDALKGPSVVRIPGFGERCPDGLVLSRHTWKHFDALRWVNGQSPRPDWRTWLTRA